VASTTLSAQSPLPSARPGPGPAEDGREAAAHRPGPRSDEELAVVHGLFVEALSPAQIGDRLRIPEAWVAGILRRACDRLLFELADCAPHMAGPAAHRPGGGEGPRR
jgi:hypothetical protein